MMYRKLGSFICVFSLLFSMCLRTAVSAQETEAGSGVSPEAVSLDENWTYAGNSVIHSGSAMLYRAAGENTKNKTVCVNAGHGTKGGESQQTLSHPDGSPKVTGGSNAQGSVKSAAITSGTTFTDGATEASATLACAMALKGLLLQDGYDVLMIRESDDVQLDNIARTVIANNRADIHIAIHFDSTDSNKGCYYCSVPQIDSYLAMEPVASTWQKDDALGKALVSGLQEEGFQLYQGGSMPVDLTQTSYSTIPSVDIEVGDRASSHSEDACAGYARGLKRGVDLYFSAEK